MTKTDLDRLMHTYRRDGYVSAIDILDEEEAARHRSAMEDAETQFGPVHYKTKIHTILRSPFELACFPRVLDIVEAMIGPDILLYNVTYIIKEPGSTSFVSWHQDLTYWGLSHDDQVSMWLALSSATEESGCMRMIPGSHMHGRREHQPEGHDDNVLLQGQEVRGINEAEAVLCPLAPGQASFHHGWTLHASLPNTSADRRIGLNVQYLAPHVCQTKNETDSALLVRGEDRFGNFREDIGAKIDLAPAAVARQVELENRYRDIAGRA